MPHVIATKVANYWKIDCPVHGHTPYSIQSLCPDCTLMYWSQIVTKREENQSGTTTQA